MLKKLLAVAAVSAVSTPAFAGVYLNAEVNSGFSGQDYTNSATDLHIGYEGSNGSASYYVQGGALFSNPDNADSETNFSGKVGGSISATEKIDVYGEFAVVTDDENSYNSKLGLKFAF